MKNINNIKQFVVKNSYLAVALQLLFAILLMATPFAMGRASAGQLTNRYIQMEDSGPSGGAITSGEGDGLQVDYKVSFNPSATTSVSTIIIDFCSNSALVGDTTCTAPTGFNTNYASLTVANQTTATCGSTAFTVTTAGGLVSSSRVVLNRATQAVTTGACSFELGSAGGTGFTNPSTVGTFYARMYTFTSTPGSFSAGTPGTHLDDGGIALATANVITITARVQESLIFCMSAASPTSNCGGTTSPAISLGTGSGATKVLDSAAVYTGVVYSQISTNAGSGATVRIRNSNACGGLSADGGTTCGIPSANSGAATAPAAAVVAGTAAFGLTIAAGSGGTGASNPVAPYANVTANYYGWDSTSATNNVTTGFGSSAMNTNSLPCSNVANTWTFAATAANVTPAGLYSTNVAAIATGTF